MNLGICSFSTWHVFIQCLIDTVGVGDTTNKKTQLFLKKLLSVKENKKQVFTLGDKQNSKNNHEHLGGQDI